MNPFWQKIHDVFTEHDLLPKLASLLIALSLWAYINSTMSGSVKFRIPVNYSGLPDTAVVLESERDYVVLQLEGNKENLKNLPVKTVRAVIDLSNPQFGEFNSYPLKVLRDEIPEGINVTTDVEEIAVRVEHLDQAVVRLIPRVTGTVDEGYIVGRIELDPDEVTIEGARSVVSSVEYLYTEEVSLTGAKEDIDVDVSVQTGDLKGVEVVNEKVRLFVPVIDYRNLQNIEVPVVLRNIDPEYTFELGDPTVKVYLKTRGQDIDVEDIDAFVDLGGIDWKEELQKNGSASLAREYPVTIDFRGSAERAAVVSVLPDKTVVKVIRQEPEE